MKFIMLLLLSGCWCLPTAAPQEGKGWRGIVPLHSTRADVERLLGKPDLQGDRYDYEDERVSIIYQRHSCEENKGEGFNVPIDTVLFIRVNFKNTDRSLSDFPVDWTQYEKKEGGHVGGYAYYTNRDKGISYETYNGKVVAVEYGQTTVDAHLRCPESLKPPKLFSSGELTAAGRELLDGFALRLKRESGASGMINLNREYRKPDEIERMRRSVEEYMRRAHCPIYGQVSINLSYQKDDIELFIFLKGRERPIRFPDK